MDPRQPVTVFQKNDVAVDRLCKCTAKQMLKGTTLDKHCQDVNPVFNYNEEQLNWPQDYVDVPKPNQVLNQELPRNSNHTPVKILDTSNFDHVAFDSSKNVLVEFYAPWCGHCVRLDSIYVQLGEMFKYSESIVIAKIDSSENELEHTEVTRFPMIKLYKKGNNEVVDYHGERTLEGFAEFLRALEPVNNYCPHTDQIPEQVQAQHDQNLGSPEVPNCL